VKTLAGGFRFAEAPRWHDGKLWFSDIFANAVMTVDEQGQVDHVFSLPEGELPCGLGFLPDGSVLVASMRSQLIYGFRASEGVRVHADLSDLAAPGMDGFGGLNDMVVDDRGRAYVGSMGNDPHDAPRPLTGSGNLILVEPDGSARIVAEEMDAPNGPCITGDGTTYIVAEFPAQRLIGFRRTEDGSLTDRRVWADLSPGSADGIAVDSAGGVWTASPLQGECRRVTEGGAVTDVIDLGEKIPLACALGGADGRTLFVLSAVGGLEALQSFTSTSDIDVVRVEVPAP